MGENDKPASDAIPDLLERARRRDGAAFTRLYEATNRKIYGYLLARTGETGAAEDLLQGVFMAALRGLDRFRGKSEGEFMSWMLTIARSKAADRLRDRYRHPESMPGEVESLAPPIDPGVTIAERERQREIAGALTRLTDEQRDVVISRFVMGHDLEATAQLLHKNVGSVKALQHRALARLAQILGDDQRMERYA